MNCCNNINNDEVYQPLVDILSRYDLVNCDIEELLNDCDLHGNVNIESLRNRILAYREYLNLGSSIKEIEVKYSICKNCLYDFIVKYELNTRDNKGYLAYNYYMNNNVKMKHSADKFNVNPNYFYRLVKELGGKKKR